MATPITNIVTQAPGVYVQEVPSGTAPISGVGTSTAAFIGVFPKTINLPDPTKPAESTTVDKASGASTGDTTPDKTPASSGTTPKEETKVAVKPPATALSFSVAEANQPVLCTNFGEFKAAFGDFSTDSRQNTLAHAVYGFFRNGGSRCYVVRIDITGTAELEVFNDSQKIVQVLDTLAALDEISIVAAPGITNKDVLQAISGYIETNNYTWVAIFDAPSAIQPNDSTGALDPTSDKSQLPATSDYAALYYPWIQVFDPVTKLQTPKGDGLKLVPPSGHIAGIYARVDTVRGVHKAPANEPVVGAAGLKYLISKAQQGALNQHGVNCIRNLNGTILVWGARTLGGEKNGEFKYVNVRRLFNYLRKSIDEGTQWTVFEPNSSELWSRIRRNVNAFLLTVWRSGALFGDTPEQAFYVKCDEETNPPANRDLGVVVIEIGVAVVRPAEFVVFNLSQWSGAGK